MSLASRQAQQPFLWSMSPRGMTGLYGAVGPELSPFLTEAETLIWSLTTVDDVHRFPRPDLHEFHEDSVEPSRSLPRNSGVTQR